MKKVPLIGVLLALNVGLGMNLARMPEALTMDILDVGQGDSILLRTAEGATVLVDGGLDDTVLQELGAVLPWTERRIDLVVMTHPDSDHSGGLVGVLQRFEVGAVLLSAPAHDTEVYAALLTEVKASGVPYYFAQADTDFRFGDLTLDVLWPFEAVTGQEVKVTNNAAAVIRASAGEHSILLTADIEAEVEAELIASGLNLQAEILKAPHHGSHSSNTLDFLEAVSPDWTLISCGAGNDYGHPHADVLDRLDDLDIQVARTDTQGRIRVVFGEEGYEVITERR